MSDKCFCHFNGFKVKDADARRMIESLSSIRETNNGLPISFWVGSNEEYSAIEEPAVNCLYIVTDDTTLVDLVASVTPVDISNKFTFTKDPHATGNGSVEVVSAKYVKALGMVFFNYKLTYDADTLGGSVSFNQNGKYHPTGRACITGEYTKFNVRYSRSTNNTFTELFVSVPSWVTIEGLQAEYLSGWYFCNGEG